MQTRRNPVFVAAVVLLPLLAGKPPAAADPEPIAELAPGTNGFIRGLLRGLSRDRMVHQVGADVPFTLTRWSDGRYSITDPATGSVLHLAAYGFANVQEFAAFLPPPQTQASRAKEVPQ